MKIIWALGIFLYFIVSSIGSVYAHSGRTDAFGCHNCYTSYCYGEYHCHGGGDFVSSGTIYLLPAPVNPDKGNWTFDISADNWCNYDLNMTWDKPSSGDRFSIAVSKYAGADPGPLVDTASLGYNFKNLTPGRWFVNMKTGNTERWSRVSYWTVDIPQPTPSIYGFLDNQNGSQYLTYQISCMDKVQGPEEFIDYLKSNNNSPKGRVLISYPIATTINLKGWDMSNKEYNQSIAYTPIAKTNNSNSGTSTDFGTGVLFVGGIIGFGFLGLKIVAKILA